MTIKLQIAKIIIALLLTIAPGFIYAIGGNNDSLSPVYLVIKRVDSNLLAKKNLLPVLEYNGIEEDPGAELLNIEAGFTGKESSRRSLLKLLKVMRVKKILHYNKSRQRLLEDMAGVSARLRLYPFAMQCYYLSTINTDTATNDDSFNGEPESIYDLLSMVDTSSRDLQDNWQKESVPANVETIEQSFNDGKESLLCALLLHVKQPSPGKRKAFTGYNNVGHMFITLVKYNIDKSFVSKTFGFYPDKTGSFDGTPFHPSSAAVIKDDSFHAWDEVAGKFISYRRMLRILRLLDKYKTKNYHLNKNNCTDFGLTVASIGGINIETTKGKWPFGKGNNPGSAGQSLLEGKLNNTDTGTKQGLFLCNSNERLSINVKK